MDCFPNPTALPTAFLRGNVPARSTGDRDSLLLVRESCVCGVCAEAERETDSTGAASGVPKLYEPCRVWIGVGSPNVPGESGGSADACMSTTDGTGCVAGRAEECEDREDREPADGAVLVRDSGVAYADGRVDEGVSGTSAALWLLLIADSDERRLSVDGALLAVREFGTEYGENADGGCIFFGLGRSTRLGEREVAGHSMSPICALPALVLRFSRPNVAQRAWRRSRRGDSESGDGVASLARSSASP